MVLNDEAVITHELTIKENADGSFMYMGNKILDDGIKKFLVISIESAFLMVKRIWIEDTVNHCILKFSSHINTNTI